MRRPQHGALYQNRHGIIPSMRGEMVVMVWGGGGAGEDDDVMGRGRGRAGGITWF